MRTTVRMRCWARNRAIFRAGRVSINMYDRERLQPGARFKGAALIFQLDSTTVLPPEWSARVDGYRNLILDHRQ